MPAQHSTLAGGSIIERRMKCLPSYKLEAAAPEPPASKYAIEGTMLHSVIQRCVDEDIDPVKLTGYAEEGAVMTADLAVEMVAPALELLEQLLDAYGVEDYEIITEARVRYKGMDAFGTCDLLISTARFVFIVDWKFGRGVVVPGGPSNKQLRFYAGAALETVPKYFEGGKEIVLAIIQPAADEPLTHGVIEREVLEDWIAEMRRAIRQIIADDVGDPVTGKHCRWCRAAPTCPAKRGEVTAALDYDPRDTAIDPVEFGRMLEQADSVESWAKQVRQVAYNEMVKGRPINGYKLVQRRATRKWDNEETACAALLEAGINEVFEQKLISPARAEKAVKSSGGDPKDLADLIVKESSGLTITTADDKRPAVFEHGVRSATLHELKLDRK